MSSSESSLLVSNCDASESSIESEEAPNSPPISHKDAKTKALAVLRKCDIDELQTATEEKLKEEQALIANPGHSDGDLLSLPRSNDDVLAGSKTTGLQVTSEFPSSPADRSSFASGLGLTKQKGAGRSRDTKIQIPSRMNPSARKSRVSAIEARALAYGQKLEADLEASREAIEEQLRLKLIKVEDRVDEQSERTRNHMSDEVDRVLASATKNKEETIGFLAGFEHRILSVIRQETSGRISVPSIHHRDDTSVQSTLTTLPTESESVRKYRREIASKERKIRDLKQQLFACGGCASASKDAYRSQPGRDEPLSERRRSEMAKHKENQINGRKKKEQDKANKLPSPSRQALSPLLLPRRSTRRKKHS